MKLWGKTFLIIALLLVACETDDFDQDFSAEEEVQTIVDEQVELARATPIPAGQQVELTKWDLWSAGTTTLRGANIHLRSVIPEIDGLEYIGPGPVGPPFVQSDFDRLSELGANYVNISHPGLFTVEAPYQLDASIQTNLDNMLAMIERADMFAVISFRTGPGRSEFTFLDAADWFPESLRIDTVWEDEAAQEAWVAMWQYTAEHYKDDPIVVGYDLMVEPNAEFVCCEIEDEPDEFYPAHAGTLEDWNQFYPNIVAGIRAVDGNTPILSGGLGLSGVIWLPYLEPTDDPRTVYTVHQYAPVDYTHQEGKLSNTYPGEFDLDYDDEDERFDAAWLDEFLAPVDEFMARYDVPVAVNEFGPIRFEPGAAEFMDDQMAVFEARGLNHALWEWGPAWAPLREDQQEFSFRLGTDVDNLTDDVASDLQDVIVSNWARNVVRPSNVLFIAAQ